MFKVCVCVKLLEACVTLTMNMISHLVLIIRELTLEINAVVWHTM